MPKVSFVMISARDSFPYAQRPAQHLFDPTLHCMERQSFKDFEWVIVDNQYETRKDYFEDKRLPFPVKHVPAKPNVWLENGFTGVSTQYNKGIIYADGEILFFTGDSYIFPPDFMETLWRNYLQGNFSLAWYMFDNTFSEIETHGELNLPKSPVPYDILGYTGERAGLEHRYQKTFHGNSLAQRHVGWDWWFGCSSASAEAMLEINGFDQKMDGDKQLMDVDVGSRLEMAGYGGQLVMDRGFWLARLGHKQQYTYFLKNSDTITIKCNYGLLGWSRLRGEHKANTHELADDDIQWIKETMCAQHCGLREFCKKNHPWQYPFEHKEGYVGHGSMKAWFEFWKSHQGLIDLKEERELRIEGDKKYTEGTFTQPN